MKSNIIHHCGDCRDRTTWIDLKKSEFFYKACKKIGLNKLERQKLAELFDIKTRSTKRYDDGKKFVRNERLQRAATYLVSSIEDQVKKGGPLVNEDEMYLGA